MATQSSESNIHCRVCGQPMTAGEIVEHPKGRQGPVIEFFQCEPCQRRAAVTFEPDGGCDKEQAGWVEREIARRGSFFPTDYTGGHGRRW